MRCVFIEQKRNYTERGREVHQTVLTLYVETPQAIRVNRLYPLDVALGYPLYGETAHLTRIGQIELLLNVRPVGFHCLWAQM